MHRTLLTLITILGLTGARVGAQKPDDVLAYISFYKEIAINEMKRTGIPAAIKLAQGIHETEAGKSDLVRRSNNHFGIKCKSNWSGDKVYHDDDARGECFRSYTRPEDSYADHSNFLKGSPRYAFLFDLDPTDYEGWAYGLRKAGYATNTRYSQILIKIIHEYNLQDYSLIALGKMQETDHVMARNKNVLVQKPVLTDIVKDEPAKEIVVKPSYPSGEFTINRTKVIFADSNTAWLALAEKFNIPLARLWDFNDLEKDDNVLNQAQLVFLQRKRKVGSAEFHICKKGESLYDISQEEGIRYESLLELNHLKDNMQPLAGEKLNLQFVRFERPALENPPVARAMSSKAPDPGSGVQVRSKPYPVSHTIFPVSPEPEFTTHQVSTRETMYSISKKYGVEPEKLKEWNRLDNMNLKIGQSLIIYKTD